MADETIGSLVVRIEANLNNFNDGINNVSNKLDGFGGTVKKLGGIIAGAFVVKEIGAFFKSTIEDAAEAEDNLSQLNTVIASTGGKAGVTATQVTELAGALQKSTKFSDDAIIAGDNLLLTFTNIGKDIFPAATETMLNMSQALGQDIKGSAIQLGKALNDPIKGITALSRVGVSFTDAQREQIKALQESGDIMGAQKVILKELEIEFGGAAKAAGETFSGKLARLNNQFGEIKESIGGALLPILSNFATWFIDHTPQIQEFITNSIDKMTTAIKFLSDKANILIPILTGITTAIAAQTIISGILNLYKAWQIATTAQTTLQWLLNAAMTANPIGLVAAAIGALIAVGVLLYKNWDIVKAKTIELWNKIKDNPLAWIVAGPIMALIKAGTLLYQNWDTIKAKAVELWTNLKTIFGNIKGFIVEVWDGIKLSIKNSINSMIDSINGLIRGLNKIKLPEWAGGFGINIPQIPKLAKGTSNFQGGLAMVGEAGRELVNLPQGSQVIPNKQTESMLGNSFNFAGLFDGATFNVRSDNDAKLIAREIYNLTQGRNRGSGIVPA